MERGQLKMRSKPPTLRRFPTLKLRQLTRTQCSNPVSRPCCWWFRNPARKPVEVGRLSHSLRWVLAPSLVALQLKYNDPQKKLYHPKDLGPSNRRVWTCIAGGRVLKIASDLRVQGSLGHWLPMCDPNHLQPKTGSEKKLPPRVSPLSIGIAASSPVFAIAAEICPTTRDSGRSASDIFGQRFPSLPGTLFLKRFLKGDLLKSFGVFRKFRNSKKKKHPSSIPTSGERFFSTFQNSR